MIDRIVKKVVEAPLVMVVLGLLIMGAGFYSYRQLPVDAFPDVSPNLVQVFTETQGLAPEEIEKYVTYPIEVAMNGLPDLETVRSVSNFGLSVVNVYFKEGMDIYFARQLVNQRLQEARDKIPEGFGEPKMGPISTGMGMILFYYLDDETGKYSLEKLRAIQDWLIKFQLQTVPGVTEVLGIGGYEKQYHVVIRPQALLRYDLTINEIINRIKSNNLNVGAQFIEKGAEEFIVRSMGLASSAEDLRGIVLRSVDGTPVYLRDVAEVKVGGAVRRGLQTRNGVGEVVAGQVIKLFGENSSTVIKKVEERLKAINRILPPGVKIVPYYDQKSLVEACVKTITNALLQGMGLVVLILFLFMGSVRPSLVVALSIPFSVLFAIVLMKYFGLSANLMSLGGLAIAIGMMVDGAIVMVENVDRIFHSQGGNKGSRRRMVIEACSEVGKPIVFAISIIVIVFVPLFALQGVEGKTFRPLAYTVAMAMTGSLIFALFLAPVLSYLLMRPSPKRGASDVSQGAITMLQRLYRPVVGFFVHRRVVAVIIAVALLLCGALVLPRLGSEFTPQLQEGSIVLRLTMAPSISLRESKKITMLVERRVMKVPEVKEVVSRIGRGEVGAHTDLVNSAEMYILLRPREKWRGAKTQEEITEVIRRKVGQVPGVLMNFTQPIEMTIDELLEGVRAELALKLFGEDLTQLKKSADEIASVVKSVPGAADVQVDQVTGTPQLLIKIDRKAIARYGINVSDVQGVVRAAIGGETAGQIFEGIRRFDILVRYAPEYRANKEAIGNILIPAPGGLKVPLSQLAEIKEILGPRQITRENSQRFITIQCNVVGRDIGSFVNEAQGAIDDAVQLPPGYLVTWGGQFKLQQEANKRLALVVPVILLVVFVLLFSSFNSVKNSMLILLNIPLALVGGVLGLWITGENLSVPASVGFIALFGIALQNGMVLVTYMNQLICQGMSPEEASIEGALMRLRPVLMTACTTALGLVPLLLSHGTGSEVQRPLAIVVAGGLVTSTMLTLLVLPALYRWFIPIDMDKNGAGSANDGG